MSERKQFEEDPEIKARVDALIAATADYQRGHVLLWEVAESVLNMSRDTSELQYAVKKWRKHCYDVREIYTWGIPGSGVKLLTEEEQCTMVPYARSRRARRQHKEILKSLKTVNIANLTEHQRRIYAAMSTSSRDACKQATRMARVARGNALTDRAELLRRATTVPAAEAVSE